MEISKKKMFENYRKKRKKETECIHHTKLHKLNMQPAADKQTFIILILSSVASQFYEITLVIFYGLIQYIIKINKFEILI